MGPERMGVGVWYSFGSERVFIALQPVVLLKYLTCQGHTRSTATAAQTR